MRIDLKKYLFFGSEQQKDDFFVQAQALGVIQFVDHSGHKFDIIPEPVRMMNKALKVIRKMPPRRQSTFENVEEAIHIASEINSRDEKIDELEEELRHVDQELSRVAIFGSFSRNDIDFIQKKGARSIQFFVAKNEKKVPDAPELVYIGKDHDLHYYVSISKDKKSYDSMVEMVVEKSYDELIHRRKKINTEIHQHEHRIKELVAFKTLIKQAVISEFNSHYLKVNANFVEHHWKETFFSVEGWVTVKSIEAVEKLLESFSIYMTEIKEDEGEAMPTHLENTGTGRIGEDLVYVYDTPANSDKDPSSWVLWAFAFFFAFIVGDGGYGFVFLLFFFLMRWKVKEPSPLLRRFNSLIGILAVSCIIWGVAVSSFFGLDIDLKNPVKRYSPLTKLVEVKLRYHMSQKDDTYQEYINQMPHLKNFKMPYEFLTQAKVNKENKTVYVVYDDFVNNIMLELALFIGVIHLMTSMLRNLKRAWSGAGWILFLIGAYLFFPEILKASSIIHYGFGISPIFAGMIGPYILYFGIISAITLAIIQHKLSGAQEVMRLIEVFADVLSYLRLYALALAGSIVANTFNGFGMKMNIFFGVIVIIAGHTLNLSLSIMGGVIHGLRLNFIEWYHYSFDGGGKRHRPLALLKLFK
ncbi:MAG: hypothetical protein S4CHLAM6_07630 [Chlamydiae bacterium]|nr:hypothetical protein [Chlamydiota bacterium]